MLCKCSGKYIDIYFILKITYYLISLPDAFTKIVIITYLSNDSFTRNTYLNEISQHVAELKNHVYSNLLTKISHELQ